MKSPSVLTRSERSAPLRAGIEASSEGRAAPVQLFLFRAATFVGSQVFDARLGLVIGRGSKCGLVLPGETVSRRHCRILLSNEQLVLEDLGSANGTFVFRRRIVEPTIITSSDAIHVGVYTLKVRALHEPEFEAPPREEDSQATTRIEAVLWLGTQEAPIDMSPSVDPRILKDSRRAARERPAREALRGRPRPDQEVVPGPHTEEEPAAVDAPEAGPGGVAPLRLVSDEDSVGPFEEGSLDAVELEARLRDLDHLIELLDDREGAASSREFSARVGEPGPPRRTADSSPPPPEPTLPRRTRATTVPLDRPPERPADTIPARRLSSARRPAPHLSGRSTTRPKSALQTSLPSGAFSRGAVPSGPLSDDEGSTSQVETAAEELERLEKNSRPTRANSRLNTLVEARRAPSPHGPGTPPARERPEEGSYDDVWASASQTQVPTAGAPVRERPMAQLDTTREGEVAAKIQAPADPEGSATITAADSGLLAAAQTDYDAIEIAARAGGTIIDVTKLYEPGEQYVLGHRTRDGRIAPAFAHPGLRLVRINDDRTVDLVFPREIGGHLIRGKETVAFSELAEGRKYSCLRLETQDVITVILGQGQETICYHVRFIPSGGRSKLLGREPEKG